MSANIHTGILSARKATGVNNAQHVVNWLAVHVSKNYSKINVDRRSDSGRMGAINKTTGATKMGLVIALSGSVLWGLLAKRFFKEFDLTLACITGSVLITAVTSVTIGH